MRVQQVLANLLDNAVKFTVRGHVTLRVGSTVLRGQPAVSILVEDSGPGERLTPLG